MNPLITMTILLMISLGAIVLVINIAEPLVDKTTANTVIKEAINTMEMIDDNIREVAREGQGSKRILKFNSPGEFEVIGQEDSVQFRLQSSAEIIEYLSRRFVGSMVQVSGSDVSCDDSGTNLTQENSFLLVQYQKVPRTPALTGISTENNILMLKEKTSSAAVYPANSSIVIDGDTASKNGTGYSEILWTGKSLPLCTVHFYVNSTFEYDIYYTLYTGADFVVMDIRNVLTK